jgi:hypothetical protein
MGEISPLPKNSYFVKTLSISFINSSFSAFTPTGV